MSVLVEVLRIPYPGFDLLLNRSEVHTGVTFEDEQNCPIGLPWAERSVMVDERRYVLISFDSYIRSLFNVQGGVGSGLGLVVPSSDWMKRLLLKRIEAARGHGIPAGLYSVKRCVLEVGPEVVREEYPVSDFSLLPESIRAALKVRGILAVRYDDGGPQYLISVHALSAEVVSGKPEEVL